MAGMRKTIQKNQILNAVYEMKNHPTAEMISEKISNGFSNISRATVYRNLNQLTDLGMIHRVEIPNGADRYDFRLDKHYHICCVECGTVADAPLAYMENLNQSIESQNQMLILNHHLVFDGVCSHCKGKM